MRLNFRENVLNDNTQNERQKMLTKMAAGKEKERNITGVGLKKI